MRHSELDPEKIIEFMDQNPVGPDFVCVAQGYAKTNATRKMSYNENSFRVQLISGPGESEMIYSGETALVAIQLFNEL